MKSLGTLAAALAVTPAICIVCPASSTIGPSLDIESIRVMIAAKRQDQGTDPASISASGARQEMGLATQDEVRKSLAEIGQLSAQRARLENELDSYGNLAEDWDDRGAIPPRKLTLRLARNLMRWSADNGFMPLRLYPAPNGEIGLVWERGEGYADLSVGSDGTVSYYIKSRSGVHELFSPRRIPLGELPGEFWALASTL